MPTPPAGAGVRLQTLAAGRRCPDSRAAHGRTQREVSGVPGGPGSSPWDLKTLDFQCFFR